MKYFDLVKSLPDDYPGISQCEIVMMSLGNEVLYASLQDSLGSCREAMCLGDHILRGEILSHRNWPVCKEVEDTVNIVSSKVQIPRTTFHYSAYKSLRHAIFCELGSSCSSQLLAAILMRAGKRKA